MSDGNDARRAKLALFLADRGKRNTRQRSVIVDVFLDAGGHLSLRELESAVQAVEPKIGFATIYRTMKLLTEAGLAEERRFDEGRTLYEIADDDHDHHDHLICDDCGTIFEYEDEAIEERQEAVARSFGLEVTGHRHVLYGRCTRVDCENRKPATG